MCLYIYALWYDQDHKAIRTLFYNDIYGIFMDLSLHGHTEDHKGFSGKQH